MKKFLLKYFAEITGLIVFIIYLKTLSPTVTEYDSGELITVQATLGIAHPTGYPLFTILGYLFSQIPIPINVAYKLNLLCAIWCAGTVIFLIKIVKLLLDNINVFKSTSTNEQKHILFSEKQETKITTAVFTGLVFGLSYTFWQQAVKTEVYSLQIFLSSLIIYETFKVYLNEEISANIKNKTVVRRWLFISILVGLAFSNHMMTIYLLPFLIYIFFNQNKLSFSSIKQFSILTIISFSISVILYSYLFFSSEVGSGLNIWLLPNLADWIDHIRAKMYQTHISSSVGATLRQIRAFGESIMPQLARESRRGGDFSINIILIVAGLLITIFNFRKLFYPIILLATVSFLISIFYAILDIQEYFLLIFFSLSLFWGICIHFLISTKRISGSLSLMVAIPALLISLQLVNNYKETDRSDNYLYEDYINAIMNTMELNSLLITNEWDYIESPAFYYQIVEGRRKDINVVNLVLLEYKAYKEALKSGGQIVVNNSINTINIEKLISSNNTYIASEVIRDYFMKQKLQLNSSMHLVPDILLFKLTSSKEYIPAKDPNFKIRIPKYLSEVDNHIIELICSMLVNRIMYELQYNRLDKAKIYYQKIISDFPMYNKIPSEYRFLGN